MQQAEGLADQTRAHPNLNFVPAPIQDVAGIQVSSFEETNNQDMTSGNPNNHLSFGNNNLPTAPDELSDMKNKTEYQL